MRIFPTEIAEQCGEPEPPITRVVKSWFSGGGPVTAVVKANEFYFLVTSWCSVWEPNQNHYRVSKRLEGPWNPEPDGYLGDDTVEGCKGSGFFGTYVDRKARYRFQINRAVCT